MSDLVLLTLYVAQQLGVMLGVGSAVVLAVTYLVVLHKPHFDPHSPLLRATRFVQAVGLASIVVSGVGAVLFHLTVGQLDVLLAPAFIFKWMLVGVVVWFYLAHHYQFETKMSVVFSHGLEGAHWLALFLVHSIAPLTSWGVLLVLYVAWVAVFVVGWTGFCAAMRVAEEKLPERERRTAETVRVSGREVSYPPVMVPEPTPIPVLKIVPVVRAAPAPVPMPIHVMAAAAPLKPKAILALELAAPHVVVASVVKPPQVKPAVAPVPKGYVPAGAAPQVLPQIRVMPRSPEEVFA